MESGLEFTAQYLSEAGDILAMIDRAAIDRLAGAIAAVRSRAGRLFVAGLGGSAAHAMHAASDFRMLCDVLATSPTDNIAEFTARMNDYGAHDSIAGWLRTSKLSPADSLLVLSVGGGDEDRDISTPLVRAMDFARAQGADVFAIVGRDGGHAGSVANPAVVIPTVAEARVTPHVEGTCAIVWHLLVSHPALASRPGMWERTSAGQKPSPG